MLGRIHRSLAYQLIGTVFVASLVVAVGFTPAWGVGLTYEDAQPGGNVTPGFGSGVSTTASNTDNNWAHRFDFGSGSTSSSANCCGLFESGISEDSPMLTQHVINLVPNQSYDVYAVYWSDKDENWSVRAGVDSGNLTTFNLTGTAGTNRTPISTQGYSASLAYWDVPPAANVDGLIYTQRITGTPPDPLVMLLGKAGTMTASPTGEMDVFIDDSPNSGSGRRTWFDGIAYAPANTPVAASVTLDHNTGAMTLTNPTPNSFQIKSYSIDGAVSGELNATSWTTVSSTNGNWAVTSPASPGSTPYATQLAEGSTDGSSITLAANGGSISFGNIWNRSTYDHLVISLTLADGSVAVLAPQYSNPTIDPGDFNANGVIDLNDFNTLVANLQKTVAGPTRVQAYATADVNGDLVVNYTDFIAFRTAYDAAHGAGAFGLAFGNVPEPSALWLLAIGLGLMMVAARRTRQDGVREFAVARTDISQIKSIDTVSISRCSGHRHVIRPLRISVLWLFVVLMFAMRSNAILVTGWGLDTSIANSTLVEDAAGAFHETTDPTGTAGPRALVNPASFSLANLGDAVRLTGTASFTKTLNNQQFRWGLYNSNGHNTGTLSGSGTWTGADVGGWLGYFVSQGGGGASGADSIRGRTGTGTNSWLENTNSTIVGSNTTGTNPPSNTPYTFSLTLRRTGSGSIKTDYTFVGGTINRGGSFVDTTTASRLMTSVNATGFLTNVNTGAGTFTNVTVEVPVFQELWLRVNRGSGDISIVSHSPVALDMNYYEVKSTAGSLNLATWDTLDDGTTTETSWRKADGSSANVLSEANLLGSQSFAPSASLSLGNAFSLGGTQDLTFSYGLASGSTLQTTFVEYVGLSGDFNADNKVDAADYVVWRKSIGTPAAYNTWRANYGNVGPGSGSGSGLGESAAVPEPTALLLCSLAAFVLALPRRQLASRVA